MTSTAPTTILVVDDEPIIRDSLAELLSGEGFAVTACGSAEDGLRYAKNEPFVIAICDIQLPGMDGLALLDRLLKINAETMVLLITAYGTVENAVAAFQRGAHDFLMKPILLDEVTAKIRRLLAYRELHLENQWLRRELHRVEGDDMVVGHSPAMQRVMETVRKVAPTPSTVLLIGESGTGKELLAHAIHRQAANAAARFLAINCAAIPHELLENQLFGHRRGAFTGADRDHSGLFSHVAGGTIFLDEVGELPLGTQAKMLRAIEQKEILPVGANEPIAVDARVIAATNKNLAKEVEAGRFRDDLYYRLNVVSIVLPPLRERRDDIPEFVESLLAKHSRALGKHITGVSHEAMQILLACPWKGNIRELENALQRAVILGDGPLLTPADLPPDLAPVPDDPGLVEEFNEAVRRFEKQHLLRILARYPEKKDAARRLGMGLSS